MKIYNFIKSVFVYPNELTQMALRVNSEIRNYYRDVDKIVVITILDGGLVWQRRILSYGMMPQNIEHFSISAKSYGDDTKSSGTVMLDIGGNDRLEKMALSVQGSHVLIVDDIYDSGRTLETVINSIRNFCPKSIECSVMVERKCDHVFNVNPRFIGVTLDTREFLVGAGLDYKDKFRELKYIGAVNQDPTIKDFFEIHVCNACGEKCNNQGENKDFDTRYALYGLLNAKVDGWYGSPALEDCTRYTFDICEHCVKNMFDNFKIPVEEKDISPFGD